MKTKKLFSDPIDPFADPFEAFTGRDFMAPQKVVVEADDDSDRPPWAGGNKDLNPHRPDHDGKPDHAGSMKGELFGDQIVLLRDLLEEVGDRNGEPVLDSSDQLIAVGYDPDPDGRGGDDGLFPIYFEMDAEGDYEIPAEDLPYVQEVELERANVARAPAKVMEKALLAAIEKIEDAEIDTDPAGRIMYRNDSGDTYATIDAPLENLALYQALMTAGQSGSWPEVQSYWNNIQGSDLSMLSDLPGWDPSALLGAAWSKTGEITLDAMIYENTTLGVNEVTGSGDTLNIEYFNFNEGTSETYDYSRVKYQETWLLWNENIDNDPDLEPQYLRTWDAVFGDKSPNTGADWDDIYLEIDPTNSDEFIQEDASASGVNDFAQAADDSRAVINFMHNYSAVEVEEAEVPSAYYYEIA